ncbi:MAG: hypothetical protein RL210_2283 [Pseudomonadota bacterium]
MGKQRISVGDIQLGKPLPWAVSDANGKLLLREGFVIETDAQLNRLIEQGMFVDEDSRGKRLEVVQGNTEPPSAVQLITEARNQLMQISRKLKNVDFDPQQKASEIARLVQQACNINRDVALAMILLKQEGSYAIRHLIGCAVVSCIVGRAMNMADEELQATLKAAMTMNLGMIEVQDKLNSFGGELTPALQAAIQSHPKKSVEILKQLGITDTLWLEMVLQHHETEDGSGYPGKPSGEQIRRGAKVIHMADRYTARISKRENRPLALPNQALRELFLERGQTVEPAIAAYFVKELGLYPPGTLVRLTNGETGIVSKASDNARTPWIHSLIGPRGAPLSFPIRRKTSEALYAIHDVVDPRKLDFPIRLQAIWGSDAAGG